MIMAGRMTLPATKTIEAFLGPFNGVFLPVRIQSIQRQRCPVKHAQVGQAASCAIVFPSANDESLLKPPSSFKLRKGQVILSSLPKKAFWEFEADLHVLHHTSPLLDGTQGVVYAGNVRQLVKILSIGRGSPPASPVHEQVENVDHLSSGLIKGSNGRVKFRFLHEPEWLVVGRTFLFRGEGRMKCVGKIIKLE
jgi:GTPase